MKQKIAKALQKQMAILNIQPLFKYNFEKSSTEDSLRKANKSYSTSSKASPPNEQPLSKKSDDTTPSINGHQLHLEKEIAVLKSRTTKFGAIFTVIALFTAIFNLARWIEEQLDRTEKKVAGSWERIQNLLANISCLQTSQELYLTTIINSQEIKVDEALLKQLQDLRNNIKLSQSLVNNLELFMLFKRYKDRYQTILAHLKVQLEWLEIVIPMQHALLLHKQQGINYSKALGKINEAIKLIEQYQEVEFAGKPFLPQMNKANLQATAYNRQAKLYRCLNNFVESFNSYEKALQSMPDSLDLLYSQGFLLTDLAKMVRKNDIQSEALNDIISTLMKINPIAPEQTKEPVKLASYLFQSAYHKQQAAAKYNPNNPHVLCAIALNLHQMEALKPAAERSNDKLMEADYYFRSALGYDAEKKIFTSVVANIYVYYGDLLLDLGKTSDAIIMFDKAKYLNRKAVYLINKQLDDRGMVTFPRSIPNTRQAQDSASAIEEQIYQQEKLYQDWRSAQSAKVKIQLTNRHELVAQGLFKVKANIDCQQGQNIVAGLMFEPVKPNSP